MIYNALTADAHVDARYRTQLVLPMLEIIVIMPFFVLTLMTVFTKFCGQYHHRYDGDKQKWKCIGVCHVDRIALFFEWMMAFEIEIGCHSQQQHYWFSKPPAPGMPPIIIMLFRFDNGQSYWFYEKNVIPFIWYFVTFSRCCLVIK